MSIGSQLSPSLLSAGSAGTLVPASNQVVFSFGSVVSSPDYPYSVSTHTLTLEVVAAVPSSAGNVNRTALPVVTKLDDGVSASGYSSVLNMSVIEPVLGVTLSGNTTQLAAGSVISYTAVVSQNVLQSGAPAYDVVLNVSLSSKLVLQRQSVRLTNGAAVSAVVSSGNSGGDSVAFVLVSVPIFYLNAAAVTVVFEAMGDPSILPTDVLSSNATLAWGTAPAATASVATRLYSRRASHTVSASLLYSLPAPVIDSTSLVDTAPASLLAVGENVTLLVSTVLPLGTTPSVTVTWTLPNGNPGTLSVLSSRVVSIGSQLSPSLLSAGSAGTLVPASNQVVFSFGSVVSSPDY
ncbi:MAG: hypothetical protein ACK5PF_12410, partial [bacterium]